MGKLRLVLVVLLTCAAAPSFADDVAAQAKRYFTSGRQHFDLGEYRDALRDFKEGYRLKDDPVFLYNIAQCHRLLNENQDAIHAYKIYLTRAPNAPNRDEVERKIAALQEAIASQEKASSTPPSGVLPPDRAGQGQTTVENTPPNNKPAETATTTSGDSNALTKTAPAREERTPVYKKWWFWTAIGGVVVVGVGVGLGVGLTRGSSSGTVYSPVQF
jgi:tetratricopeptide (TPR) repeat protein